MEQVISEVSAFNLATISHTALTHALYPLPRYLAKTFPLERNETASVNFHRLFATIMNLNIVPLQSMLRIISAL